ncbi:MAG: FMN-binding protein [Lachnospiraceae bacterium]|nr:FMN-binding protein [Lachnospiraceae bacterium]
MLEEIIKDPLGEVDAVSGATFSTKAVIEAYDKALKQAGINR